MFCVNPKNYSFSISKNIFTNTNRCSLVYFDDQIRAEKRQKELAEKEKEQARINAEKKKDVRKEKEKMKKEAERAEKQAKMNETQKEAEARKYRNSLRGPECNIDELI